MKKLIAILVLCHAALLGLCNVYVLEGVYQGEDIYVQNPFSDEGVGFCIFEVQVNGLVTSDEVNSSAFAVDLSMYEFQLGAEVIITIRSKANCEPKIINPSAISPSSTAKITEITLQPNAELTWKTEGENGKLPFIIEHFKWNKWVQIGSILGEGTSASSTYSVKVNLPNGNNKLRIKQKDYNGEHLTDVVEITVNKPEVELLSKKVSNTINFSGITHFELFDGYGDLVKSGYAESCNVINLPKGLYYLNYEKSLGIEIKKK